MVAGNSSKFRNDEAFLFFNTTRTVGVSLRKGETKETRGDNSNLRDDQTARTQIHSRFGSNVGIYLFSAY
jgi:hypothetical protein